LFYSIISIPRAPAEIRRNKVLGAANANEQNGLHIKFKYRQLKKFSVGFVGCRSRGNSWRQGGKQFMSRAVAKHTYLPDHKSVRFMEQNSICNKNADKNKIIAPPWRRNILYTCDGAISHSLVKFIAASDQQRIDQLQCSICFCTSAFLSFVFQRARHTYFKTACRFSFDVQMIFSSGYEVKQTFFLAASKN